MKIDDVVSLLSNRINQPHYIKDWLTKVFNRGVEFGKPTWIDVNEKKPEQLDRVMCCLKNNMILELSYGLDNRFFNTWTSEKTPANNPVTHWMRLPESPKD